MSIQRYVSRELTHFVGGDLREKCDVGEVEEHQYALLVRILLQGNLGAIHTGPNTGVIAFAVKGQGTKLSSNEKYSGQMVCFCDIPVEDLTLHMQKYSRFGLAFSKSFLIVKGASPVFYVPENSVAGNDGYRAARTPVRSNLKNVFDAHDEDWNRLLALAYNLKDQSGMPPLFDKLHLIHSKLGEIVYSRLKFFDAARDEEHEHHFYMEREWRVWGTVPFAISDVVRLILPSPFAKRIRQDVPDYYGQLTFSDQND